MVELKSLQLGNRRFPVLGKSRRNTIARLLFGAGAWPTVATVSHAYRLHSRSRNRERIETAYLYTLAFAGLFLDRGSILPRRFR